MILKVKKYWYSMIFIGLMMTGCATTNSVQIENLEKSDKVAYNFLKNTHSWVTIDTSSENYQKWKNEFVNGYPKTSLTQVENCLRKKNSLYDTIEGRGQIGFDTYRSCVPARQITAIKVGTVFETSNIFGWINVLKSTPKRWSNGIYEDYEMYKIGIIEIGDNKAELFSRGWYRWGYSAEKDGQFAQDSFRKGVWAQDEKNVQLILNTLDAYNIKYTKIK